MVAMNEHQLARARFRASEHVRASISGDGLALLDVEGGLLYATNQVGARVWELMRRHTAGEIAHRLAGEYAVPIERTQEDVFSFLRALVDRALVIEEPTC